jgi:hypothetical protein
MMYSNKFVATIKSAGKVLREQNDTVYLPFGSEYSILLKNLNTVRAQVLITIDDVDVLGGSSIVVNPNSDVEIERFLKDLDKGNRFKFIERTASVEQHRGIGAADGIVRIEWQFEKPYVPPVYTPRPDPFNTPWYGSNNVGSFNVNGALRGVDYTRGESTKAIATAAMNTTLRSMSLSSTTEYHEGSATMDWAPVNDAGITVPGSISNQKFHTVASFPLETQKHAIVLQLKGETEYNKVTAPVTVKTKPKCITCGKVNKATSKFCANCGTALEIV